MVNMQSIDGVSFNKGCYTGQEVVARMQYLGRLKRRMYVGEVESPVPPRPGDALEAAGSGSEQGAGRVVDARAVGGGRYALLAVVEIEAAEGGEVRLGTGGPVVRLGPPPYGFPAAPV
jgi:tRNA-modifying protein YgfZ